MDEIEENIDHATGISGRKLATVEIDICLTILSGHRTIKLDTFPVKIIKDEKRQPQISLLGRHPFFYDFRVDFRMGYTEDKTLGKFVLYPEKKKRKAKKYKRPISINVKK